MAFKGDVKVQTLQKLRSWNYRSFFIPHTSHYTILSLFCPSTTNVLLFLQPASEKDASLLTVQPIC